METKNRAARGGPGEGFGDRYHEVAELLLLLPCWQMAALEAAARRKGQTVGQMLRGLITSYLDGAAPPR